MNKFGEINKMDNILHRFYNQIAVMKINTYIHLICCKICEKQQITQVIIPVTHQTF